MTNRNVRIARRLVKLAKSLCAEEWLLNGTLIEDGHAAVKISSIPVTGQDIRDSECFKEVKELMDGLVDERCGERWYEHMSEYENELDVTDHDIFRAQDWMKEHLKKAVAGLRRNDATGREAERIVFELVEDFKAVVDGRTRYRIEGQSIDWDVFLKWYPMRTASDILKIAQHAYERQLEPALHGLQCDWWTGIERAINDFLAEEYGMLSPRKKHNLGGGVNAILELELYGPW